ncbi:MAG: sigma-70 family RNA polymerase sigma factor [Thermodesulfobacteriota bacterium]
MADYRPYLRACLSGDKNAFAEVVKLFQAMALTISRRRLGRIGLAEDAVQEAFLTAYLQLPQLRELEAFPAWFKSILRTCIGRLKREYKPYLCLSDVDEASLVAGGPSDPEQTLIRCQSKSQVEMALASLEGVMREACVLRYLHDLSYQEIASILGAPVGTVKRRLHGARDRLAQSFARASRSIIRVGHLPITDHLLAMVSHHRHDQADFEIRLQKFLSWPGLVTSLLGGRLDAAFVMAPLAMHLRNKGAPLVYVLDGHHNGSAITLPREGSIKTLEAVKRMGLPYTISTQRIILASLLETAPEPGPSTMTAKYISPSYIIKSLVSNRIDAFFCAEPWNAKSVFEGSGRLYARSRDVYPGHMCCILVVREEFAAHQAEILSLYLKALLNAGRYIAGHPEKAAEIQSRYTGVPADIAAWVLENSGVSFNDLEPDRGRVERLMTLACRTGLLDQPCDLDAFIHTASF